METLFLSVQCVAVINFHCIHIFFLSTNVVFVQEHAISGRIPSDFSSAKSKKTFFQLLGFEAAASHRDPNRSIVKMSGGRKGFALL